MKKLIVLCAVVLMVLILQALVGCWQSSPDVIEVIAIFPAESGASPPSGVWGSPGGLINPHPERIQQVFSTGDKMFLGLRISNKIKANVTFSRFTYFNKDTGEEIGVGSPNDLMRAWEPGQVDYLAFNSPWQVPDENGEYELRLYMGDELVASALFNVGIWPVSWGPEMIKRPAPIYEVRVITGPHEPPWLDVVVCIKGGLPQGCEASYRRSVEQTIDDTIYIEVTIRHLKDVPCEDYVYFEETFNLRPSLLKNFTPGETYKVDINGNIATFIMP